MLVVREKHATGERSIRLKCSRKVVKEFNIPERGFILVHMKRFDFQARYDVSGSSFRINFGGGFSTLFLDEGSRINVVFKVLNGSFEMFYKEDEKALFPPQMKRAYYKRGFYFCGVCGRGYYMADICPVCGAKTRKGRRNNGDKPRVNIDYGDGV